MVENFPNQMVDNAIQSNIRLDKELQLRVVAVATIVFHAASFQ
jgi:hypothetical protein